jgi:hypothetical protein
VAFDARNLFPALIATFVSVGCTDRGAPVASTDITVAAPPSSTATIPAAPASAPAAPAKQPSMKDYPWARLPPVEPVDLEVDRKALDALGVRSFRAFSTTDGVRMWLLVFEFDSQPDLLSAQEKVLALFGGARDNPPFYPEAAHTGAWLLVAGFPGSKPVSPEMDAAKKAALQRWWGEE